MKQLPVFASAGEVLSGVTRHYFQLLFAAWPAMVFFAAAAVAQLYLYDRLGYGEAIHAIQNDPKSNEAAKVMAEMYSSPNIWILGGIYTLNLVGWALAAVRWHRFVLLGEGVSSETFQAVRGEDGSYVWTALRLFLVCICITFVLIAAFGAISLIGKLSGSGGGPLNLLFVPVLGMLMLWLVTVVLRFSLVLPAAAVGAGTGIFNIYEKSKENGARLLGLSFLLSIPAGILGILWFLVIKAAGISMVPELSWAAVPRFAVFELAGLFFGMLQVTMLSVAYREIIGLPDDTGSPEVVA